MVQKLLVKAALASVLALFTSFTYAADQPRAQQAQTQTSEQIYGSQMMTRQERTEFRSKMHAAKTAEEREQIRKEHHERMKERAKERGINLPDEPPEKNGGMMGSGAGGMGMGPGGGDMGLGGNGRRR